MREKKRQDINIHSLGCVHNFHWYAREKKNKHRRYLLVIRGPDTTGDLTLQVNLGGPVSLPADWPHQDEAIAVRNKSLGAIMGPSEVTHLNLKTKCRQKRRDEKWHSDKCFLPLSLSLRPLVFGSLVQTNQMWLIVASNFNTAASMVLFQI